MQTAECRLDHKMQTETKTVFSSNTGYPSAMQSHFRDHLARQINLIFDPFLNSLFSLSQFGSFLFPEALSSQRRLELNPFALVQMSFSPVLHSDCKKCRWLLIGSLRASSLGGGRQEGEGRSTPKRACSQAIYLGELAMLEVISLLKDSRLYAPHSQIWPEYKLETASC